MRFSKYILLSLALLMLLCSCDKEWPDAREPEVTAVVPFSVTVETGLSTRASFSGDAMGSGQYLFATGDALYITGGDAGQVSGKLTLASGAGTGTGQFRGDLSFTDGYEPTDETVLSATLVGASQTDGFFTVSGDKITAGPVYPAMIDYASLAEIVQKYSHFTASFPYHTRQFALTQQTVFLNFKVDFFHSALTGSPSTLDVELRDAHSVKQTVQNIPVGGNTSITKLSFTTVMPADENLQGVQTWVANGSGIYCEPDFAADVALSANKYYRVTRTAIDPFTVEAPSTGTGASVTFNYPDNVEYRTFNITSGVWSAWEECPTTAIVLSAGEKVSFRGKRTSYANNNHTTPLISSDNLVYIYGDMMSLICDENWERNTAVEADAFKEAFLNSSKINIPADKDLVLSAVTLGSSCYKSMFKGCTSLDAAPQIDATTLANNCFQEMFSGCSVLRTAQDAFAFSGDVPEYACYQMFLNCIALTGAPDMPSVGGTIGNYGCKEMYKGCNELRTGPSSLNATTVGVDGYSSMFYNCARLEQAPNISATSIGNFGCAEMFRGCTRMQTPPASLSATTLGNTAYKWMFYQCSALKSIPDFPHDPAVTYVLPGGAVSKYGLCYQMFFQCNALISLADRKLFSSSTLMTPFCFEDMFSECRNLDSVPTDFLPATSVAASCYRGMFQSTKITRTPDLPASTLVSECYRYMFNGCSALTYIKCLATTNIGNGYTTNWVGNNKTGGNVPNTNSCKFERAGETDWPSGVNGKLSNWVYYTPTP